VVRNSTLRHHTSPVRHICIVSEREDPRGRELRREEGLGPWLGRAAGGPCCVAIAVPTMFSLGTFFAAFVISIVLAFGEIGDGVDIRSLRLGLVYTWLPILVITTIVDRNPVSSERTA
jgi:hypothetical protein